MYYKYMTRKKVIFWFDHRIDIVNDGSVDNDASNRRQINYSVQNALNMHGARLCSIVCTQRQRRDIFTTSFSLCCYLILTDFCHSCIDSRILFLPLVCL